MRKNNFQTRRFFFFSQIITSQTNKNAQTPFFSGKFKQICSPDAGITPQNKQSRIQGRTRCRKFPGRQLGSRSRGSLIQMRVGEQGLCQKKEKLKGIDNLLCLSVLREDFESESLGMIYWQVNRNLSKD